MENSLRAELEFFRIIEPRLIQEGHLGDYVVIHDQEILAMGRDADEAFKKLLAKCDDHAPEPLLIRQVLGDTRKPVCMRSPKLRTQP